MNEEAYLIDKDYAPARNLELLWHAACVRKQRCVSDTFEVSYPICMCSRSGMLRVTLAPYYLPGLLPDFSCGAPETP